MAQTRSGIGGFVSLLLQLLFSRFLQSQGEYEERQRRENFQSNWGETDGGSDGDLDEQGGPDPFQLLGVERTAGDDVDDKAKSEVLQSVRKAWKKASLKWHPDRARREGVSEEEAKIKMQEVNEAYEECKKQLGQGDSSDEEAEDVAGEEEDEEEEMRRMWQEMRKAHAQFRRQQKAEQRRFARAQEQVRRRQRGGRAPPATGGKAKKRARQRQNAARANAAAAANAAALKAWKASGGAQASGSTPAAGIGLNDPSVPSVTVFESTEGEIPTMVREDLQMMFRSALAKLINFARYHGEPERIWQTLLDDSGNTILHYCAFFGRLEMAMSLVQHAGEQWWRCALAKNDAGKTAWGVAIDGSKHNKIGQSFGWAAKSGESNLRSRANSAASAQEKDRDEQESASSAAVGDDEKAKTHSEGAADDGTAEEDRPRPRHILNQFKEWEEHAQQEEEEEARRNKPRVNWRAVPVVLGSASVSAFVVHFTPGLGLGCHPLVSAWLGLLLMLLPVAPQLTPSVAVIAVIVTAWLPTALSVAWWFLSFFLVFFRGSWLLAFFGVLLIVIFGIRKLFNSIRIMALLALSLTFQFLLRFLPLCELAIGWPYRRFHRAVRDFALEAAFQQVVRQQALTRWARLAKWSLPHLESPNLARVVALVVVWGVTNFVAWYWL